MAQIRHFHRLGELMVSVTFECLFPIRAYIRLYAILTESDTAHQDQMILERVQMTISILSDGIAIVIFFIDDLIQNHSFHVMPKALDFAQIT